MVNSGSFDSDGYRNGKARCTQTSDAATGSQLSDFTDATCKNDCSKSADTDLPSDPSAIEPTPSKTEINSSISTEASSKELFPSNDDKGSLCCSLPLEKIQGAITNPSPTPDNSVTEDKLKRTRKLLCLYCDRSFVSANLRQKHVERVHIIKLTRRVSARRQNQLSVTTCVHCDKLKASEHTLNDLFRHLVQEHPTKYFGCLSCEERFPSSTHLVDHNFSKHNAEEKISIKRHSPTELQIEEIDIDSLQDTDDVPLKVTRSKLRNKTDDPLNVMVDSNLQKRKKKSKLELRSKKISVKTSKIALKRSKRLQAQTKECDSQRKRREKKLVTTSKSEAPTITKQPEKPKPICVNPYPEFDNFYRVKKITDHSIDNLKISSLTFDDVFDKAFFNRIKCNIEENLLHHIDGKLFKNEESENRISNFEKISTNPQEIQSSTSENYGCELSLNAITPVPSLSLNSQFGEDFESQIEYGSKPSKKKTQTKSDEVHYKYFTRRKYQASILQQKENRDLSKLDMWTQMVVKERQEKLLNKKKNAKEIQEYTSGQEYKNKMKRAELNRILDRRGPFEDLKEEASKKAAFDKLNSSLDSDISQEVFTDVRAVLNDILEKVFEAVKEDDCLPEIINEEVDDREIPAYLDLRRKDSSFQEEIDKSDRIALICSSQETENYELPTNTVREKNEVIELTGEWARSRMYICAACGGKFSNIKYLLEHRSIYHQNVWVQNYEFVGNQSELYRHLSIPGLGKVGVVEDTVPCKQWRRSDARICTKCGKQCNSLGELHRHILECGGDWTWMLARKKCKYRPFGTKSRRKRRGLVPRIHNKQKTEPTEKKKYKKPLDGPRQRPSDADTIQRMLANLPAKRSRRSLISLRDVVFKSRKTKQGNNTQTAKVKCGKTVCKKQNNEISKPNISQQRNSRSLRSLNKVLSSRILDLNSTLIVKRKLKVIRDQRSTKSNLQTKEKISDTVSEVVENEVAFVNSASLQPQKRNSLKKCTNNSEGSKTVTRISLSDKKKNLTKKMLSSRLNIKNFFPVKKKNVTSTKKKSVLDQDKSENDAGIESTKKSIYLENSQNMKKNKRGGLKGFVRALSLRKRNSKHEEPAEKTVSNNSDTTDAVHSNSTTVTKKIGRPKSKNVTSLDKLDKESPKKLSSLDKLEKENPKTETNKELSSPDKSLSKKRKLQRGFRNVINKVKKIKTEKTSNKSNEDPSVKNSSEEINAKSFLEKKSLRNIIRPENVAISAEVQENIQEKKDHAHIADDLLHLKENSSMPEIIPNENNTETIAPANGEPKCDNEQTNLAHHVNIQDNMPLTEDLATTENGFFLPDLDSKVAPVSIDTTLKPKCIPLISPNIKGKIRKPNRGLNDCIAMLTNKLQQKDEKTSSSLESLFSTSSTTSMERADSRLLPENISPPIRHQKNECILKIPTFRALKSPVVEVETALDLSKKSYSSPNLSFQHSSDTGFIESTINKVIEGVIEHKCKEVLTEKFAIPTWTSVDDIIQQVVQNSSSTIFSKPSNKKNIFAIRTNVDETIDYVVNTSSNWFESKNIAFEEKRKLYKKLRRKKNSDDNLIKDIIFGKDKLIIAPSSTLHNALENSLIAKIKENESKISKVSNMPNTIQKQIDTNLGNTVSQEQIDKDSGNTLVNNNPQIDKLEEPCVTEEKLSKSVDQHIHKTQIVDDQSDCAGTSPRTLVGIEKVVNKALNSEDHNFKETVIQIKSYDQDTNTKDKIENVSVSNNEKLFVTDLLNDNSTNINGSLEIKHVEDNQNCNLFKVKETLKKGKTKGKGRGKKVQTQGKLKLSTQPVIETCIDHCLNVKLISDVELQSSAHNLSIENSSLDNKKCINKQIGLITENEPIILENKVVEQAPKSLLSDSEDEVPLAVIAKQEENNLPKHSLCGNGKVIKISKNDKECLDLKELQGNEHKTELLNLNSLTPKLLEEASLKNKQSNTFSNSCRSLNLNKDIVENLTTDSLKENIEQTVNKTDHQNYVCNAKVKTPKTHKITRPIRRKRRKIVFKSRKSTNYKRKLRSKIEILIKHNESKNHSVETKKEQKTYLNSMSPLALDTIKVNNFEVKKPELPKEYQSDLPQEAAACNESVNPLNVTTQPTSTEVNEPGKILTNSQRTRRKSKSSKKVNKFENDLFKNFSLVINKKTKRIPPTNIVDDSVCDDVLDDSIDLLVKSNDVSNVNFPDEANEPLPLVDSVEEMDMEIEDIPINTSIIERDNQQIITINSYKEKNDIPFTEVNIQRPGTPINEVENSTTRKSKRKRSIPDLNKPFSFSKQVEDNIESNSLNIKINERGSRRGRKNKIDNTDIDDFKTKFSANIFEESSQKEQLKYNSKIFSAPIGFENSSIILNETANNSTGKDENKIECLEDPLKGTCLPVIQNNQDNFLSIGHKQTLATNSTGNVDILERRKESKISLKQKEGSLENVETCKSLLLVTSKGNKKENTANLVFNIEPAEDFNVLSLAKQSDDKIVLKQNEETACEKPKVQENKDCFVHVSTEEVNESKSGDILGHAMEKSLSQDKDLERSNNEKSSDISELSVCEASIDLPNSFLPTIEASFYSENNFEDTFKELTSTKRSTRQSKNKKIVEAENKVSAKHQALLEPNNKFIFVTESSYGNTLEKNEVTRSCTKTEEYTLQTRQTRKLKNKGKLYKERSEVKTQQNVLTSSKIPKVKNNENILQYTGTMDNFQPSLGEPLSQEIWPKKSKNSENVCEGNLELGRHQSALLIEGEDKSVSGAKKVFEGLEAELRTNDYIKENYKDWSMKEFTSNTDGKSLSELPTLKDLTTKKKNTKDSINLSDEELFRNVETYLNDQSLYNDKDKSSSKLPRLKNINKPTVDNIDLNNELIDVTKTHLEKCAKKTGSRKSKNVTTTGFIEHIEEVKLGETEHSDQQTKGYIKKHIQEPISKRRSPRKAKNCDNLSEDMLQSEQKSVSCEYANCSKILENEHFNNSTLDCNPVSLDLFQKPANESTPKKRTPKKVRKNKGSAELSTYKITLDHEDSLEIPEQSVNNDTLEMDHFRVDSSNGFKLVSESAANTKPKNPTNSDQEFEQSHKLSTQQNVPSNQKSVFSKEGINRDASLGPNNISRNLWEDLVTKDREDSRLKNKEIISSKNNELYNSKSLLDVHPMCNIDTDILDKEFVKTTDDFCNHTDIDNMQKHSENDLQYSTIFDSVCPDSLKVASSIENSIEDSGFLEKSLEESPNKIKTNVGKRSKSNKIHTKPLFPENIDSETLITDKSILKTASDITKPVEETSCKRTKKCKKEKIKRTISPNSELSENKVPCKIFEIKKASSDKAEESLETPENKSIAKSQDVTDDIPVTRQSQMKEVFENICEELSLPKKTKKGFKDNKQSKEIRQNIKMSENTNQKALTTRKEIISSRLELSTVVEITERSTKKVKKGRKWKSEYQPSNQNNFDGEPLGMDISVSESKNTNCSILSKKSIKFGETSSEKLLCQVTGAESIANLSQSQINSQLITVDNEINFNASQPSIDTSLLNLRRSGRNKSGVKLFDQVPTIDANLGLGEITSEPEKHSANKICEYSENYVESCPVIQNDNNIELVSKPIIIKLPPSSSLSPDGVKETLNIDKNTERKELKNTSGDNMPELSKLESEATTELYILEGTKNLNCNVNDFETGKRRSRKTINYNEENLEKRALKAANSTEIQKIDEKTKIHSEINPLKKNKRLPKNLDVNKKSLNATVNEKEVLVKQRTNKILNSAEVEDFAINGILPECEKDKNLSTSKFNDIFVKDYVLEQTNKIIVDLNTPAKRDQRQRKNLNYNEQNLDNLTENITLENSEIKDLQNFHNDKKSTTYKQESNKNYSQDTDTEQLNTGISGVADLSELPELVIDLELMDREYEELNKILVCSRDNINKSCENLAELNDLHTDLTELKETSKKSDYEEHRNSKNIVKVQPVKNLTKHNVFEGVTKVESVTREKSSKYVNFNKCDTDTLSKCNIVDSESTTCLNIFDFEESVPTNQDLVYKKTTRRSGKKLTESVKNLKKQVCLIGDISEKQENPDNKVFSGKDKKSRKYVNCNDEKLDKMVETPSCKEILETVEIVEAEKATHFMPLEETKYFEATGETLSIIKQTSQENLLKPILAKTAMVCESPTDNFEVNNDTLEFNVNPLEGKGKRQKKAMLKVGGKKSSLTKFQSSQALKHSKKQPQAAIKRSKNSKKRIDLNGAERDTMESSTDKTSESIKSVLNEESIKSGLAEKKCNMETTLNNANTEKELVDGQIFLTTIFNPFFLLTDTVQEDQSKKHHTDKEITDIVNSAQDDEKSQEINAISCLTDIEDTKISKEKQKFKKLRKNIMDIDVANILDIESNSEHRRSSRKKKPLNFEKPAELVGYSEDQMQSHNESLLNQSNENDASLCDASNLENDKSNLIELSVISDEKEEKIEDVASEKELKQDDNSSDSNESVPLLDRMTYLLKNVKNKSVTCINANADVFPHNLVSSSECMSDSINNSKGSLPAISPTSTDKILRSTENACQNFVEEIFDSSLNALLPLNRSGSMEDLILKSKSVAKLVKNKSKLKRRKGKKNKLNERQMSESKNTFQNEILAENTTMATTSDVSKTEGSLTVVPDEKYQVSKINIKNLLLTSLAVPKTDKNYFDLQNDTHSKESNNSKHAESISDAQSSDITFKGNTSKLKGKKLKGTKVKTSHQIDNETFQQDSSVNLPHGKYIFGKTLNLTALKNALSTIAKPSKTNKRKETKDMFSEIKPLTDIITSSEIDIAPVLDEIDKSLESEDIYDFNEEGISAELVSDKSNKTKQSQSKIRSRSCPKSNISNSDHLLNNETSAKAEQMDILLKEPTRIKSKRSAKVKALKNIHEKVITELDAAPKTTSETQLRKARKRSKSLNASKKDELGNLSKDNKSKNCNEKSDSESTATINNLFSCQEGVSDNTDKYHQSDLLLKSGVLKKLSGSSEILERDLEKSNFIVQTLEPSKSSQNLKENNSFQDNFKSENQIGHLTDCQELRRSRRGSRKVGSYNENDLIDPLIDALEDRRNRPAKKEKLAEKHLGKKDVLKDLPSEKSKLNTDELFDLLKNSSYENENLTILKPRNSFLENLDVPNSNTDFQIDEDFDNILEKPSFIFTGTEKLKDIDKIYEFTEDSPENTEQVKEYGTNKRKLPVNQENISSESKINLVCNNSIENSLSSYASKEKDVDLEKSNYCEICKKTFMRIENLIKHKTTLTHISKLSELEAKEAEERTKLENEKQRVETPSNLLMKTSDCLRDEINIRDILQQSERTEAASTPKNSPSVTSSHPLNLVDIISDVLNKPVLENFNSEKHGYTEMTIHSSDKIDIRRYKSLGERKSFESESQLSRISTPLSESYLPTTMSKTTILENQIHLLENIIGNKLESLAANEAETKNNFIDEISSCSNNSNISAIDNNSCVSNRTTFSPNSENIPANSHTGFIKPVQYEEISEDSGNARIYEDSKLRKTLNRDEELFLECCSLLKSGSEVSNSNYSKNQKTPLDHFKELDELENKKLIQTVEEAHEYSDNSRTPTPLGDTYDDEASNSNTISSNWNLKSERPLDKNRSFSFEEVVNKEEAGISFGEVLTKGLKNQFEYMPKSDERCTDLQEAQFLRNLVTDGKKDDSDSSTASKKISTKGARKIFEGLKVSIPTEDLNLDVLNPSLTNKNPEFKDTASLNENQTTISNKSRPTRKSKPVKKSQVGSNLLFKVNKKKTSTQTNSNSLRKKQDIYNFEENQDSANEFTKPFFKDVKVTGSEAIEKIASLDSDNESLGYADSIGADAKSVSSVSSISAMSTKKPEVTPENVTKKKYKIMGKIFRNAAKSKMDEIDEELRNIPEIPEIDNLELVKNYVRSCQRIKSPFLPPPPPPPLDDVPKKPKMTEEEMNLLFDQLLGKEINESKAEKSISKVSLVKVRGDSKTGEVKKRISKIKNRKRARLNSESSDDEFNINRTAKKRTNKKNNQEDSGINLELELKECIGVASRKSQRKCTSGKQNVLVEYWSSDEEAFEAMLNNQKVQAKREEETQKTEQTKYVIEELTEKEPIPEVLAIVNEKSIKPKPAKRKTQPSKKIKSLSNNDSENRGTASTTLSRRKRAAANPLYHWSSSSEDESQSLIEIKPIREEDDEEDRPIQHGWIVGDSPKKLVTMLALTKGKKTDIDSVKEQGKRRTSNTVS